MQKALMQLHLAVLFAGFTGVLGRIITLNEGLLVWYRLAIALPILALLITYKKQWVILKGKEIASIFVIGVIAALHWVTFYASIKYSNVSIALVCFSSIGFFTAIFDPILKKRTISKRELLLGLLPILGISLIFQFDPNYKVGIILGIIAAILGSIFPILSGQQLQKHSTWMVTFYYLFGALLFLTITVPFYLKAFPPTHILPTTTDWMGLLVLSVICTVWAIMLSMSALKYISAFTVNLSYNLEPIYGILLAFILYREDKGMGIYFYLGLACILLSVALQTYFVFTKNKTNH